MTSDHDEKYFNWQRDIGAFGGMVNLGKFVEFIEPGDRVIDFGCGGGFLMSNLRCAEKIGVEPNTAAREHAKGLGIEVHASVASLPDQWADVIISNHALEHVRHPLQELKILHEKLKPGGKIVFVVPCESISYGYRRNDPNQHLYSWSPMALGNLFNTAGFQTLTSEPYVHKWPPGYQLLRRILGDRGFHIACRIWGRVSRKSFQVRIVAVKGTD